MERLKTLGAAALLAATLVACDDDTTPLSDAANPATMFDASTARDSAVGPTLDGTVPPFDAAFGLDAGVVGDGSVAVADGGAASDAGGDPAFASCVSALKAQCSYEDKEMACSSMITLKIPLSDGGTMGGVDVKFGPYGGYVEWNEGKGFENPVNILENGCDLIASTFGEPPSVTADVLNLRGQDLALYTVVRPACMHEGEKFPVITWGNGTCGQSGGYGSLMAAVASHGFVVVMSNSRYTDGGNKEMLKALDFAKAANADATSPLYQHLDMDKVGAMGHSQGSQATVNAASDPRIKSVILWNGGSSAVKPFLAVSGDRDIGGVTLASLSDGVKAAAQPGAWLYMHQVPVTGGNFTGHLTLMMQPERVAETAVNWWKFQLKADAEAKKAFVGTGCSLCTEKTQYEYGANTKLM